MKILTAQELTRAAELLDVLVRPGDHMLCEAIGEAQLLLGYKYQQPAKIKKQRMKRRKTAVALRDAAV